MYILLLWCQMACPDVVRAPAIVGAFDTAGECNFVAGGMLGLLRPGVRGECLSVGTTTYKPPIPTLPQGGYFNQLTPVPNGLLMPHE